MSAVTNEFDLSSLQTDEETYTLADRRPDPAAMVKFDSYWYATCPYCKGRLLIYDHEGRAAFICYKCAKIWPTNAKPSAMGHRVLVQHIVLVECEQEAAA